MPRIDEIDLGSAPPSLDRHLELDPAVNQVPIAFLEGARNERKSPPDFRALLMEEADEIMGAAIQRLPYDPIVSRSSPEIAEELGREFRRRFPETKGVHGPESIGRAFARGAGAADSSIEVKMAQGLYRLDEVAEIPQAAGRPRPTESADAPLLLEWMRAFSAEALPDDPPPKDQAGERLATSERCWIWELEDGTPVSFVNNIRRIPGLWAISPVYTPLEHRGRGYASSAVAFLSRHALANGADACTLFTDLANPTSNRIYERIGYRRIGTFKSLRWT